MSVKYDASMTQYHSVIAAAIKRMCGRNKTAMDFVNDASPAPLRDFLKKTYKYSGAGDANLLYNASPASVKIESNKITNNDGSHSVILSWSQVAKFIRDNPSEIFDTYGDTLSAPAQDDGSENMRDEEDSEMNIEKLDLSVRTYNAFKRAGVNTVDDYFRIGEEPLKRVVGEKTFEEFVRAMKRIAPVPQEASEISETFNYAVLSAELGDYLRQKEEQLKNEYMSFTANCGRIFAEAQEKLARHGFGESNGVFEKWITAMGFTKSTVYRMISIYNFRSSQIETNEGRTVFDALPKTLRADISAPSAPPELVEQVMSGDITTHKEYIALKKELEATEKQNAVLRSEKDQAKRTNTQLNQDYKSALDRANKAARRVDDLESELNAMRLNIEELESRPRDVAVQSDPEDAKRIAELEKEIENLRSKPNELDFGDDDGVSADKLSEFYEMLHGKVLAALKDCKAFVLSDDLPQIVKDRAVGRFGTLKDLITMYIEDMEE